MLKLKLSAVALLAALGSSVFAAPAVAGAQSDDWWQRLEVRGLDQRPLLGNGRWIVLVFISPECPVANASVPVLNALAKEFAPRGFFFVGAYADPNIPLTALQQHEREYSLAFSTADDRRQLLVSTTGATYTPEAFVFARDGALLYRGRIDDRVGDFGAARPAAVRQDLREVLAALATEKSGPFKSQPGFGCSIPEPVK